MASTGIDRPTKADVPSIHEIKEDEKNPMDETPIAYGIDDEVSASSSISDRSNKPLYDNTHRKLKPRHIQLMGIGGYGENKIKTSTKWILRILCVAQDNRNSTLCANRCVELAAI